MDEAVREVCLDQLVRDSHAVPGSIEIVRARRAGDRMTAVARWTEARTGRSRRGAVDVVETDGRWRAAGGWSGNADRDAEHPVWRAWGGGSSHSTSGWVTDPAAATVRVRALSGEIVDADAVEDGVAILIYDGVVERASVDVLDGDGTVLHTAPLP